MRVSVDIEETYLDPMSAYGRYRRAMLWNPPLPGEEPETMLGFLASLEKAEGPHGGPFRYRSPNSDLLGIIVERASGERYADFMRDRLWARHRRTFCRAGDRRPRRHGACRRRRVDDRARSRPRRRDDAAGRRGSGRPRRLGALGARHAGRRRPRLPGRRAISRISSRTAATATNGIRAGLPSGAFCAIGIHGQWLYVDPAAEVTIVRLSSQPLPVDDPVDLDCLRLFAAISEHA